MDWAHIHIMIDHFPVILVVMGALASALAIVRPRRGAWLYATASLTLAGITVVPTYFTGWPADHALNDPWYIATRAIDSHEESAKISAILTVLAALVAVVAWRRLVRYPREVRMPTGIRAAVVITSVVAALSISYTALLGERIFHDAPGLTGPRPAAAPAQTRPTAPQMAPRATATPPAP
jgi:uncharacterized membrane protein